MTAFLTLKPATPGRYKVEWTEEVTRSAVIDILPEDCEGADNLGKAAEAAIENCGHPENMMTSVESQEDFFVTAARS